METKPVAEVSGARVLALLGDSVTTDHISPAGSIAKDSPAADYLRENGVDALELQFLWFSTWQSRGDDAWHLCEHPAEKLARARHRGRLRRDTSQAANKCPSYDASLKYQAEGTPLIVLAGSEYGTGSSAGLGRQRHDVAGCQSCHCQKLRAHPSFEFDRHGRVTAAVHVRRRREFTGSRWH